MNSGLRVVNASVASAMLAGWAMADTPASVPVTWAPYDMIIELNHLPKTYTCNDLWYKFRDVLWAVDARGISEILAYDCGPGRADQGLSPKVHVVFTLPRAVTGIEARGATERASSAQIRLAPGHPMRLDDSDCVLLQQMNNTLFRSIPLHVVSASWNCQARVAAQPSYALTLQVLKAATAGAQKTTGGAGAHSD
ncbi:MAG TPA: hypothetical protein VIY90_03375 [Steroidobacteraceae bacterium]